MSTTATVERPTPWADRNDADQDDADRDDEGVASDAELTALALAADPDVEVGPDAVPLRAHLDDRTGDGDALLPDWYMPAVGSPRVRSWWLRGVILGLVATFLLIEACGLCTTYGPVLSS